MVKELKRKFIKTTMLVVTILLVVFLVSVNTINFAVARNDSRSRLEQIVVQNLRSVPDRHEQDRESRRQNLGNYFTVRVSKTGEIVFYDLSHDADTDFAQMVALINEANVSFAPQVTGETETGLPGTPAGELLPLTAPAPADPVPPEPAGGSKELPDPGKEPPDPPDAAEEPPAAPDVPEDGDDAFQEARGRAGSCLYYAARQIDGSVVYVFLDVSRETESMLRVILITAALGVALWFLILMLVVFLSKKAIAPIAQTIEKQRLFITDAGHEFKTPLAVILSNVDVQELHGGKTKWLDHIRTQALRLSDMTKQMLTLAKMEESGTAAFVSTTFDASQVLEDTIRIFRESASLRGIRIQTSIEAGVRIHFSKEQYQQMLELLLDNAVKYGKENGFLSAALHADRKMIHLAFRNDCEVLPDTDPDHLFDRFYRPDSSRSRNTGGSGIGLAVVRAIAEQGGGSAKARFLPDQVIEFDIELLRRI